MSWSCLRCSCQTVPHTLFLLEVSLQHILSHMFWNSADCFGNVWVTQAILVACLQCKQNSGTVTSVTKLFSFLEDTCQYWRISVKIVRGFFEQCLFHRGGNSMFSAFHSDVPCEIQGMSLRPAVLKLAAWSLTQESIFGEVNKWPDLFLPSPPCPRLCISM